MATKNEIMKMFLEEQTRRDPEEYKTWLVQYLQNNPNAMGVASVIDEFSRIGLSGTNLLRHMVDEMDFDKVDLDVPSPLRNFLVGQSKVITSSIYPKINYRAFWHLPYFKILEESNGKLAIEYAYYSLYHAKDYKSAIALNAYKGGQYIPAITQMIYNKPNDTIENLKMNFDVCRRLYFADNAKYKELLESFSRHYLEYFDKTKGAYEYDYYSLDLDEPFAHKLQKIQCSSYAFHFLLSVDRVNTLKMIEKWQDEKKFIQPDTCVVLFHHLGNESFSYFERALINAPDFKILSKILEVLQISFTPDRYLPVVWSLATSKTKATRELVAAILLKNDKEAERKAIALLEGKNGEAKQTAGLILANFKNPATLHTIMNVINSEKNDNARDVLLETVEDALPADADEKFIAEMIAAAAKRGKLKTPVEDWLDESALPPLFYKNGKELTAAEVRFLIYRMSRVKTMRSDIEARYLLTRLDKEKSAPFALKVLKLFTEKDAKPEYKYLLALAALTGDDTIADKLQATINHWIDDQRLKMAAYGIDALAIQGSDKSLRRVEWLSRKYKSKPAIIGTSALAALDNAGRAGYHQLRTGR